jgi:hypothetical protein
MGPAGYAAIGEFVFRYAQLEYQMHEIVWAVMGLEYKASRALSQITLRQGRSTAGPSH